MKDTILIVIIAVLVAGGAGFFAGMKYQQTKKPSNGIPVFDRRGQRIGSGQEQGGGTGMGMGQGQNGRSGFRPINGEIISADDKSVTVKLNDGSTKIVLISTSTQINKAETASTADLTAGETVSIFGTTNTDGSVSAQNIQLNPVLRGIGNPVDTAPTTL